MFKHADAEALLRKTDLFQGLPDIQLTACAAACTITRFTAGEMIFGRGEDGDSLYVIASGRVKLSLVSEDGRELSVRIAGNGDLLGEMSTLDGAPRSADAVALDAVEALVLTRKELKRLMLSGPAMAESVIQFLCRRLRATTDQLELIALHSVEQRLARLLLAEFEDSKTAEETRQKILALPQSVLGQLIGASRPKANVALSALERAGAIRRVPGGIQFNTKLLRRIAGLADD
jgi:CRP/FNR family transcriptional regulator, cyclic AMP receptor protein